ncbi:UNVERIFIED_CONTAM: hypothetical protein FKN15_051185 [Acipenser sinensis]
MAEIAVLECRSRSVLNWEQVNRLNEVLTEAVPVHGRGNFPTLEIRLKDIVQIVRNRLDEKGIKVRDICLNGSTASHVLVEDNGWCYKDLDLIFRVDLPSETEFKIIKDVVLSALLDFLPEGVNKDKITSMTLKEAYVQKLVKVSTELDRWSLISLSNNNGRNVELKFVDSIRRQFEFSVDSFQIILDSLLFYYDCSENPMSKHFHPTVIGESVYGDFEVALDHLKNKLIATKNPEEIRGGGLLKYCNLLSMYIVQDYLTQTSDCSPQCWFSLCSVGICGTVGRFENLQDTKMAEIAVLECRSRSVLNWEQVNRLNEVLTEAVPVHGRGNFPTLEIRLKDIVQIVRNRLDEKGIKVGDICLNGSTASHVLVEDNGWCYKDLDLIFRVDLPSETEFKIIKDVVLSALLDFLPEGVNKDKITSMTLKEAYVQKLVKVSTELDR